MREMISPVRILSKKRFGSRSSRFIDDDVGHGREIRLGPERLFLGPHPLAAEAQLLVQQLKDHAAGAGDTVTDAVARAPSKSFQAKCLSGFAGQNEFTEVLLNARKRRNLSSEPCR